MFRREHEVIPPGLHEGGCLDFAETVHDRPAPDQVTTSEDERFRTQLRAPLATDQIAGSQPQARLVGVGRPDPDGVGSISRGVNSPLNQRLTSSTLSGL
jgi:hypothetical protein